MKVLSLALLVLVLAAGGVYAETASRVLLDAEILLGQQQDRSAENRLFMETSILVNHENRIRLNDYRSRFNNINSRINIVKNQINTAINVRVPRIEEISFLRQQLQGLMDEHNRLINDFRQWVSSL